ncbi:hypothetical protein A3F86_04770 [candidate division WOR-1 bacterium RIFCSPLOWO2_12_FULL_45_9]|uniref:Radical SAM core domain-containing protein n=1 Tax=candidate division WOR-1 bacterium RIFCSPLOWO2_12_FULL_45_9 TaxID=1802568 RepID=A0A1F4RJR9_UNCSA|nr:MAG: hypothetical protein A3F86_04770 [candidate division WOR-1 bacterium RIFCSPLOWO2_12_FULL_45_9]
MAEWTEYDNGFPVVIDPPAWPLDQQSFLRPYPDLLLYRHNAEVKWNVGCWARCSFCANEPTALDYRSPDLVLQELAHLRGLGAKNIGIAAANFLADPHRTSKIVDILPDDFSYVFFSRVDSLYLAIEGYPDIWRRFSIWRNRIQLGVESFLPERLAPDRLGKYPSLRQAMSQEKKLKAILDFFAGTSVIIDAELIWLDWKMTLEEDEKDREILKALLSAYPDNFQTSNGSFMNYLRYSRGSRLAEEMKPVDFFDFQRDPRLLFLYAVIETSVRDDPRINWMESAEPWNHQLVVPLLDYITLCRGVVKELPVETFTLGPILEIILREEKERDSKVSEAFYAQLPRDLAEKLRSLFDLAAEEIFGQNSER